MALIPLLMSIAGCAKEPSSAASIRCESVVAYTKDEQTQARTELDELPAHSVIRDKFMPDYGRLRDRIRACQAVR